MVPLLVALALASACEGRVKEEQVLAANSVSTPADTFDFDSVAALAEVIYELISNIASGVCVRHLSQMSSFSHVTYYVYAL